MTEKQINLYKKVTYLGIIGLFGFMYFINYDLQFLFYLSYLAFFAYYPMYRELKKGVDERTKENISKSNKLVAIVALFALILLGFIPNLLNRGFGIEYSPDIFVGGAAFGLFCSIITHVASFFYYEKE